MRSPGGGDRGTDLGLLREALQTGGLFGRALLSGGRQVLGSPPREGVARPPPDAHGADVRVRERVRARAERLNRMMGENRAR